MLRKKEPLYLAKSECSWLGSYGKWYRVRTGDLFDLQSNVLPLYPNSSLQTWCSLNLVFDGLHYVSITDLVHLLKVLCIFRSSLNSTLSRNEI